MDRQKTIERIVNLLGISENDLTTLGKLIDLEEDKERVHSVELRFSDAIDMVDLKSLTEKGTRLPLGVDVNVYKEKWFKGEEELINYLREHSFPEAYVEDDTELEKGFAYIGFPYTDAGRNEPIVTFYSCDKSEE